MCRRLEHQQDPPVRHKGLQKPQISCPRSAKNTPNLLEEPCNAVGREEEGLGDMLLVLERANSDSTTCRSAEAASALPYIDQHCPFREKSPQIGRLVGRN